MVVPSRNSTTEEGTEEAALVGEVTATERLKSSDLILLSILSDLLKMKLAAGVSDCGDIVGGGLASQTSPFLRSHEPMFSSGRQRLQETSHRQNGQVETLLNELECPICSRLGTLVHSTASSISSTP